MENTTSPLDLFTLLEIALEQRSEAADAFDIFKENAVMAHAPEPGDAPGDAAGVTSEDAADAAAGEADAYSARVEALLSAASDTELASAYQQTGGDIGHPVAEALLGEIKRRSPGN